MRHTTAFEDDGTVGVLCDGQNAGMLDVQGGENPKTCPRCGATIKLEWSVRIVELKDET